ncbi:MAG TPA: hypothetical protein PLV42_05785 [bacterium]|nr:hypothetical protein [bacterium]
MPNMARHNPIRKNRRHEFRSPEQKTLFDGTDHGHPIIISADCFAPKQQGGGWGVFAEAFLRANELAFKHLEIRPEVGVGSQGTIIRLFPGGRAGAMPLRSAQTQQVVAGLVVKPRFGWSGVGKILDEIGWHASLEFADLPMVPGSGREVPPWVIAGPVISRLAALLAQVRRGYRETHEMLTKPRGKIIWNEYIAGPLRTGMWHRLPCTFPELSNDPQLRSMVKWCLERLRRELLDIGGNDKTAATLAMTADRLIELLRDVSPRMPRKTEIEQRMGGSYLEHEAIRRGVEAIGWTVDERGLGGGRELDGLAWHLPLSELWESYVETIVRREAALVGADVRCGRKLETVFPIRWTDPSLRGMSHLVPDFVVWHRNQVKIIDAKYKAHFSELDESGWLKMAEDSRDAHRSDFHQVLAYAALFDARQTTVTLVYPLRRSTYEALSARNRDIVCADLSFAGRTIQAELRGIPFGDV